MQKCGDAKSISIPVSTYGKNYSVYIGNKQMIQGTECSALRGWSKSAIV